MKKYIYINLTPCIYARQKESVSRAKLINQHKYAKSQYSDTEAYKYKMSNRVVIHLNIGIQIVQHSNISIQILKHSSISTLTTNTNYESRYPDVQYSTISVLEFQNVNNRLCRLCRDQLKQITRMERERHEECFDENAQKRLRSITSH